MSAERFWEMVDAIEVPFLVTVGTEGYPRARPMILLAREGTILWFATSRSSRKVAEIQSNPRVTVLSVDRAGFSYASLCGRAEVVAEPEKKERFWREEWREEWPKGSSDPDYVLLRVKAERGASYCGDANESSELDLCS